MRFSTFLVSPKLFSFNISTLATVVDNEIVEVLEESHWNEGDEGEESWKCLVYQIRSASSA